MCIKSKNWELLSVVTDGEYLEIEGVDVWMEKWSQLDVGTLEVPHPSYPNQRHTLWINCIESNDRSILFAAGELSNCVWCFYVPRKGQLDTKTQGMTVNEKLSYSDLFESFDKAINAQNKKRAVGILVVSGLATKQARETVESIIRNPLMYGYK